MSKALLSRPECLLPFAQAIITRLLFYPAHSIDRQIWTASDKTSDEGWSREEIWQVKK
jgi:hypothetical protein